MGQSAIQYVAGLPDDEREKWLGQFSNEQLEELKTNWRFHARPEQMQPEGNWGTWLILAGRGWGKTRTGAETVREWVETEAFGPNARIALVGATTADIRKIMIEGESGLLSVFPEDQKPEYKSSKGEVHFKNGYVGYCYPAEEPDRLRGPQHHCFIAGTMIKTASGEKPVESIVDGDKVYTRNGLRPARKLPGRYASLAMVELEDGTTITGTLDHPFYTMNRGWVDLQFLRPSDTLCLWKDDGKQTQGDMSTATLGVGNFCNTGLSGQARMGQYQQATRSTTLTTKRVTIGSKILSACLPRPIRPCIRNLGRLLAKIVKNALTPVFAGERNTASHVGGKSGRSKESSKQETASTAGPNSKPDTGTIAVKGVSILGAGGLVHNLSVEGEEEYFANGVLVHNCAWCDELAAWKYPETYDQLAFGLRLGDLPKTIVTTTPRPIPIVRELMKQDDCFVTRGSTFDNRANLPAKFIKHMVDKYEGTRLGRQELYAEILDDVPGALWKREDIDKARLNDYPHLSRVVVAVDPSVSNTKKSDECGIVVVASGYIHGDDRLHAFVLEDLTAQMSVDEWASKAVEAFHEWGADRIVAEVNNGGDLVEKTIKTVDDRVSYKAVRATRGKYVRAEPIAALYEQGRVHHIGSFPKMEDQMCLFTPDLEFLIKSPDRADAVVWGLTELMLGAKQTTSFDLDLSIGQQVSSWEGF